MDSKIVNGTAEATQTDLVVMLKAPANAKRRLAAEVGDLAGEAAAHLLDCALEDARCWSGPAWLSPASQDDRDWLLSKTGAAFALDRPNGPSTDEAIVTCTSRKKRRTEVCGLVRQRGKNLGERINYVDSKLRMQGVARLIFVGTDCPGLDSAYLEQAAATLQRADAVVGPAADGGVVLMGARRPWPDLKGLGWSTQNLCADLRDLCRETGWSVATLDAREDVDTLRDLLGTGAALSGDGRVSRRGFAQWLKTHRGRLLALQFDGAAETARETSS